MKTGKAGITLIKLWEGYRLRAYQDTRGIWTIGYGDTLDVHPGLVITPAEAETRLATRLARDFEPGVAKAAGGTTTSQHQFDAMVSLAYNIGVRTFAGSSVARFHRASAFTAAADAFLLYNHVNGMISEPHTHRRQAERKLYLTPDGQIST